MSREMFDGDRFVHLMIDVMDKTDDDLTMTVKPMSRDNEWVGFRFFMYRDGCRITADPLYAWFCWVEKTIAWLALQPEDQAGDWLRSARNRMIEHLDAAWEE